MLPLILFAALAVQTRLAAHAATVAPAEPFEALSISWTAAQPVEARVRVSADGVHWSEWTALPIDSDSSIDGRTATGIAHFGAPQLRLETAFSGPVADIMVTTFPLPEPERLIRSAAEVTYGSLPIRSREQWGCPDGETSRWTPAYTTVTHAVVHHTAGSNTLSNYDAELRNIWYLHTVTNGWGDIGYNFLIAPDGTIFEGRAGGAGAIGAHFSCRNSNTAGVALLGTFSDVAPSDAALTSLQRLLAEVVRRNAMDPSATLLHPSSGLNLPTILGHRDGNVPGATCTVTECPGSVLYSMLPAIRTNLTEECRPVIDVQPSPVVIRQSQSATLTVKAHGPEPLTYQWYTAGVPIDGATSSELKVSPSTSMMFSVRVSSPCGAVESLPAIVNVAVDDRRRAARH